MKQLSEFVTYQEAVDYEACKKITSNKADQFLSLSGIKTKINNNLSNETLVELIPNSPTTIGLICDVIIQTLSKTGYVFNLDKETEEGQYNIAALSALVLHGVVSESDSDMFLGLGKYKPYTGVTETDYIHKKNMANSVYTSKIIKDWQGQDVIIELSQDLMTKCAATTWIVNDGFVTENAGRSKQIEKAGKYKLDMSSIRQRGNLEVRIPFENVNFTVSV